MALPVEPFQMTSPVEAASILLNSLGLGLFVPVLRPLYRYLTLLGINPLALIAVLVTPWIMWKAATRYLMITVEISPGELSPAVQHLSTARRLTGDNMIATLERTAESKPRLSPENPGNNRAVSWWSTWKLEFYPLTTVWFWANGTLFNYQGRKVTEYYNDATTERMVYSLSCFGHSTEPIEKLLRTAVAGVLQSEGDKVALWYPTSQPTHKWQKKSLRRSRSASTIVIDLQILQSLLADVGAFLHPDSEKEYHARGIPHRRGYLIYGPPGTGKTSLVHVIASEFELPIYFLSLKTLTDESLFSLTTSLPHQCLLLIEDIDSAGLDRTSSDPKQGVTLSGYLNATDGFAAPEGKVLVITTNNPKSLDSAILRPGRVDYQVHLTNASKSQAKQLFQNNYHPSIKEGTEEDIGSMAQTFADKTPELMFSPAKIQQYLRTLEHRDSPKTALENVSAWVAGEDLPGLGVVQD
ncbi:hypothetical protein CDV36_014009 [Fusarium kuroshium]|uniref:AAA+ ATPase domain-containing protein n=1 Tax=Fusarium kuroshium TaxID=2010991 RepID=A0A3M2RJ29_9HYPO|nr:hypothetical protein CDV36_014009 [Fusarium kuroshium]